ncbi:MAG: hypothetical protein ACLS7Z_09365 [Christensenellales bacterium]
MTTKEKLLALLEDSKGTFSPGRKLPGRFRLCAAVKAVNASEDGYTIDAATNRATAFLRIRHSVPQGIRRFQPEYRDLI